MRSWPLATLGLLAVAGVAASTTWQVTYDPGNTLDRIGQVVQQAASDDSILVGPGTYYEHINLGGKSLSILSTNGCAATILDGSEAIEGRSGSIIYACPLGRSSFCLSGFTLRGGTGAPNQIGIISGGAVCVWNREDGRSGRVAIENCVVTGNRAWYVGGFGGGVYLANLDTTLVEGCHFQDNKAFDSGGSLYIGSGGYLNVIQDNEFVVASQTTANRAAAFLRGSRFDVVHNRFTNEDAPGGCGLTCRTSDLRLIDNDFIARPGSSVIRVGLHGYDWGDNFYSMEITGNRFYAETLPLDNVFTATLATGAVSFVGNTLIRYNARISVSLGVPQTISNNLLFHSPLTVWSMQGGTVMCNDAWPDSIADEGGNLLFDRNISEDPMLCDVTSPAFDVSSSSNCSGEHSVDACGWIGVGRIGCSQTPVCPTSWGRIKALFRGEHD